MPNFNQSHRKKSGFWHIFSKGMSRSKSPPSPPPPQFRQSRQFRQIFTEFLLPPPPNPTRWIHLIKKNDGSPCSQLSIKYLLIFVLSLHDYGQINPIGVFLFFFELKNSCLYPICENTNPLKTDNRAAWEMEKHSKNFERLFLRRFFIYFDWYYDFPVNL